MINITKRGKKNLNIQMKGLNNNLKPALSSNHHSTSLALPSSFRKGSEIEPANWVRGKKKEKERRHHNIEEVLTNTPIHLCSH